MKECFNNRFRAYSNTKDETGDTTKRAQKRLRKLTLAEGLFRSKPPSRNGTMTSNGVQLIQEVKGPHVACLSMPLKLKEGD